MNAGTKPAAVSAWRYVLFLSIAGGGCLIDLLTKHWVFQWLGMPGNTWWIWEGYFGIQPALNPGALFGMGAGQGYLFAILSIIFGVGIVYAIFWGRADRDLLLTVALGCVLGGMLGNLHDRLGFWHPPGMPGAWRTEVRDWILVCYGKYTWPNFNIADSLLVCGVGMLVWHAFRKEAVGPTQ